VGSGPGAKQRSSSRSPSTDDAVAGELAGPRTVRKPRDNLILTRRRAGRVVFRQRTNLDRQNARKAEWPCVPSSIRGAHVAKFGPGNSQAQTMKPARSEDSASPKRFGASARMGRSTHGRLEELVEAFEDRALSKKVDPTSAERGRGADRVVGDAVQRFIAVDRCLPTRAVSEIPTYAPTSPLSSFLTDLAPSAPRRAAS
jgi:hypothetical protein